MSDPNQGGSLSDMAVDGTSVPSDAAKPRVIRSVPRPDQILYSNTDGYGADNLACAADNATDIPRRHKDIGATGEVITGTGDHLPAQVGSKRLHYGANEPAAKGHDRVDKHKEQNESVMRGMLGKEVRWMRYRGGRGRK
jgi:hypothetical protein